MRRGAGLMVLGALIFLAYAVVFCARSFSHVGFELGVETLNGVTRAQLDQLNPGVMAYIQHLHVAVSGFIAATAIAVCGLSWFGVRSGSWWAWITAVISPVTGLMVALPLHYTGWFQHDWVAHLGPIYVGTLVFVAGAVMTLVCLVQAPRAAG
jgi:integral membrane sensor domain MASE1